MILIYSTFKDKISAQKLAKGLLEDSLAACINLIPQMTSMYKWDGKIEEESEVVMLVKTTIDKEKSVISYIEKNHPYECPAIFSLASKDVSKPYAAWLSETLTV